MIYLFMLFIVLYSNVVYAYIGPGMGGGVIAATIGIIVAIFAALIGLIWFPVKRFLKGNKEKKDLRNNKLND